MPEDEYHGPKDELSSSGAKLILASPAKFKHQFLDGNRVHRASFDVGTAVHTKVLGTGAVPVTCPPELLASNGAMSTKEARAWKAEQLEAGVPVVSASELLEVNAMAEAVLGHPLARKLFEREGKAEVSVFAEHLGVKNRARFDYLPDEGGIAVDLKTAEDGSPRGFATSAARYGYHIQRGHYLDVLERATGRELEMLFVTVEKEAPHLVTVHQLDADFADMGVAEALEARDILKRCVGSGEWPGYPVEVNLLKPPVWAVYDYQDRYGERNK
ncbi:PD-(D/E)XK nuclease-like domain-containing protein [Leucobacter sp. UT-8R-CII-1-4]|nr:PD-(D/E)XK nuclease-like domain-containing protein [Leucobacter sp. UT-8R-CII-1-4]MDI6024496.1 PD-(D/E)XK nuclease-like domain-containing protein [Leucobacter sp. UT-8R-CII-1-4]